MDLNGFNSSINGLHLDKMGMAPESDDLLDVWDSDLQQVGIHMQCNSHVADGLPYPLQIATKLGVHFSEDFKMYKDNMGIKKKFHLPDSAKQYV